MWLDLPKFCYFGKKIKRLWANFRIFGKLLYQLWLLYATGQIIIVVNGQILDSIIAIWSHCIQCSANKGGTMLSFSFNAWRLARQTSKLANGLFFSPSIPRLRWAWATPRTCASARSAGQLHRTRRSAPSREKIRVKDCIKLTTRRRGSPQTSRGMKGSSSKAAKQDGPKERVE